MNITELNQSLQFLYEEEATVEILVYTILKDEEKPQKLDIKADDLPEITKMFIASINSQIIEKTEYSLLPLSTADERGECFYQYDLELPEELTNLETVITTDKLDTFDFRNNKLSDIDSLIIVLAVGDDEISIYKKFLPLKCLDEVVTF